MGRLEELIRKNCPDGVEYIALGNTKVFKIFRGVVISKDYILAHEGEYPVYSSQTMNNGMLGKIDTFAIDGECVTWTTDGANAGTSFYRCGKFNITNVCGAVQVIDTQKVNTKYLGYVMQVTTPRYVNYDSPNPKLMSNVVAGIEIPVPPLFIQDEIVKILDKYTQVEVELEETLEAELKMRKQQYEYYRDKALSLETYKGEIEEVSLGSIARISRGGNFQKKDFIEKGKPCIHYGQIYTRYGLSANTSLTSVNEEIWNKSKKAKVGSIVMAVTSENYEDVCKCVVWEGNEDAAISGHAAIIEPSINAHYLAHYFGTSAFYKQKIKLAHGTKVIEVTPDSLNDVYLKIPKDIKEQKRIADILDNFLALISDMEDGIPAEIKMRHQQYEYYRDKLLTFERI